MSDRPFALSAPARNVIVLDVEQEAPGRPVEFLLRSDAHFDNPDSLDHLETKHLDQAIEQNATILDLGDLFDVMEGKHDRRASKHLRPEHTNGSYLNQIIGSAADRYQQYARNWALLGMGNHEYSVAKHAEFDLTQQLSATIHDRTGYAIHAGGFANWIVIRVHRKNHASYRTYRIYAHHGYGGGGVVTKGAIQGQRAAARVEGADLYMSGHIHEAWHMERLKTCLDFRMREVSKTVDQLCIPSYKEEFFEGKGRGFHHEKGRDPKPVGAWWLRLWLERHQNEGEDLLRLHATFERAK